MSAARKVRLTLIRDARPGAGTRESRLGDWRGGLSIRRKAGEMIIRTFLFIWEGGYGRGLFSRWYMSRIGFTRVV